MAKKPERNPSVIEFGRDGVRQVFDELPRDQVALDMQIGSRFLHALRTQRGVDLSEPQRGDEPADLIARGQNGGRWHIQIAEIVNRQRRDADEVRREYERWLTGRLAERPGIFSGCLVTLTEFDPDRSMPPLKRTGRQECAEQILAILLSLEAKAAAMRLGAILHRTHILPDGLEQSVLIERTAGVDSRTPYRLWWSDGQQFTRSGERVDWLTKTVRAKVAKHYVKPQDGLFVLLLYATDILYSNEAKEFIATADLLRGDRHPFDEVWYMFVMASTGSGMLTKLWPT